jgi:predicted metal-dependent peptidase
MDKINNIDLNKIINEIISNNSIYSTPADVLRDKIIARLSEEPYFTKQFKEAESESEADLIGSELGDLAYQVTTLIYKRMGLD